MPTPEDHEHGEAQAGLFSSLLAAEPPFKRVLLAIGHTVTAAATLEKTLGIMIAHRLVDQNEEAKLNLLISSWPIRNALLEGFSIC